MTTPRNGRHDPDPLPHRTIPRTRTLSIDELAQYGLELRQFRGFRPGLGVTVVLGDGREERAVIQWKQDNMVGLLLLEDQRERDVLPAEAG